ncbi:uncharacterized protein RSE6_11614 [Rhynchosporium secalis]|uniref:Uncharacterized protein n=1 Tax=Rhynchosporium secalis TaxID=38038 RepID=A0A1E1MND7_RHYSE|nr:uncharacterized protein RSE6_11614 [Rhynchosporium secalis]
MANGIDSYETFSVCDLRSQGGPPNILYGAMTECCAPGSAIRSFQCWKYCAVAEPAFSTWLSCVATAINTTQGAYCQRADQSPVSTATSFPISHQPPVSPAPQPPFTWPIITTIATTTRSSESSGVATTAPVQVPQLVPRSTSTPNTTINNTAPPTEFKGGANSNTKTLELSVGGVMFALLAISVFTL